MSKQELIGTGTTIDKKGKTGPIKFLERIFIMRIGKINTILLIAFISISGIIYIGSLNAENYLNFCKENDYETAGTRYNELICFTISENFLSYRAFNCAEDKCNFIKDENVIMRYTWDINKLDVNLID